MKPHEEWLFKAEHDLRSAELLFHADQPVLDISIYHTQQCAEKSLKAYLSLKKCTIDKTHNLDLLLVRCVDLNPDFTHIRDDLFFLMPFATAYRYPEGDLLPSNSKTEEALLRARAVYSFVMDIIDKEQ